MKRRSLTHVGGPAATSGDREAATLLAQALDVPPAPPPGARRAEDGAPDDPDRAHVHGFHTYPARMHPVTAARLARLVTAAEGATVLDPFCGSGTVLAEAMIAGRRAVGRDLNPLAVRLASLKTSLWDAGALAALPASAASIAAIADERRSRRAGATRRYPPADVEAFDPHVLLELDSLRTGIVGLPEGPARPALELVLSAILLKVSRQSTDTGTGERPRRVAAGYAARLFVRKTEELARRLGAFARALPPGATAASVAVDDAARLSSVGASTVDGVVTSPPYLATYDYLAHHALRMRWLELDPSAFAAGEMGSRRRYGRLDPTAARGVWENELGRSLRSMARVCRPGGRVALVIADSAVAGQAIRADAVVADLAPRAGLALVARASQSRPHFHTPTAQAFQGAPRAEHAILLEKRTPTSAPSSAR